MANLLTNTTSLQEILESINTLPDAGGVELPELTNEGTASDLLAGKQLIDQEGNIIEGAFSINDELTAQDNLIAQIQTAVDSLPEAIEPTFQSKTVTPTASSQTVTADSGYDGLSKVTVNGDINLVAENIKNGISIFGVSGTLEEGSGGGSSSAGVCPQLTITGTATVSIADCMYSQNGVYMCTTTGGNAVQQRVLEDVDINSVIVIRIVDASGLWDTMTGTNATFIKSDAAMEILLAKCTAAGENSTIQLTEFSFPWG